MTEPVPSEKPVMTLIREPWTFQAPDIFGLLAYGIGGSGFLAIGLTSKDPLFGFSAVVASIFPWMLFGWRFVIVRNGCRIELFEDRISVRGIGQPKSMLFTDIAEAGYDYNSTSAFGYVVLGRDKSAIRIPFLPGIADLIQALLDRSGAKPILKSFDHFRDQM